MAKTTAQAFSEFSESLKPTAAQKEVIAGRRESVVSYLTEYFGSTSDMPLISARLIGSASRATMIRPLEDIDVLAIFEHTNVWRRYKQDSRSLLYRVRDALDKYQVKIVGSRGQAVRLFYVAAPYVDITPVFRRQGGGYFLPAGDGKWLTTDPDSNDKFLSKRNQELGFHLKPFSRMLKQWNRVHSNRLRGFHLEVMGQAVFKSLGSNYRAAFKLFYQLAPRVLHVADPAGHSGDLARRLTTTQERQVIKSFSMAHERAGKALDAESKDNHQEAIRLWTLVFGDEFPGFD